MSAMIVEYDKKYHTLYNKFYLTAKRNNCRIYDCEGYLEFAKELYATELDNYMKNGIWSGGRKLFYIFYLKWQGSKAFPLKMKKLFLKK